MSDEDLEPVSMQSGVSLGGEAGHFTAGESAGVFAFIDADPAFEAQFQIPSGAAREGTAVVSMVPGDSGKDIERCCREAMEKGHAIARRMTVPGPGGIAACL